MKKPEYQQTTNPVRPEKPTDAQCEQPKWKPGSVPKGGYRSVIADGGSKTSGGGNKVY